MRVQRPRVMCHDKGDEETGTDLIPLTKHHQRIEPRGLTLTASQQLRSPRQRSLLQQPSTPCLDPRSTCPACGTPLQLKACGSRAFRTLCGPWKVSRPRLEQCDGTRPKTSSFRPLAARRTESVTPALRYMEAQWASRVSYGRSLDALQDFLPLDRSLDVTTVRDDTLLHPSDVYTRCCRRKAYRCIRLSLFSRMATTRGGRSRGRAAPRPPIYGTGCTSR